MERLRDLVARADLYDGRHVGRDARGSDGQFDRLEAWVNQPVTVILVTSSNPSFEGGDPARTQLLQELACIEDRLRAQAGRTTSGSRKC